MQQRQIAYLPDYQIKTNKHIQRNEIILFSWKVMQSIVLPFCLCRGTN
jgi:hypothetical protein